MSEVNDASKNIGGAGAPWWAQLATRFGATAVLAGGLLYYLGELMRTIPATMERQVDRLAIAIKESAEIQVRSTEAAERRAEERTRMAVERLLVEINKANK